MVNIKVTVFTTTTCPYCKLLKEFLEKKSVSFEEKIVDTDDAAKEEMLSVSNGFLGVPFVLVKKEGGAEEKIIGFDQKKLENVLGL